MDIEFYRKQIEEADREIAALFEKRMSAAENIARIKAEKGLEIFVPEREKQLTEKNLALLENPVLREYYKEILTSFLSVSKKYQREITEKEDKRIFGLLGYPLKHSFSSFIHNELTNGKYFYGMFPIKSDELDNFMTKRNFKAINVTAPYKQDVIKYCEKISEKATKIGAVNTIVNKNGSLFGYNTDYDGVVYTLNKHNFDVKNKVCAILGSGGTYRTVNAVLSDLGAKEILVFSRNPNGEKLPYDELYSRKIEFLVNCTPVGTYPNTDETPCDISKINSLEAIFDVIYNPEETVLLKQAKSLGIPYANGLEMLTVQAKIAAELFIDEKIPDTSLDKTIMETKEMLYEK